MIFFLQEYKIIGDVPALGKVDRKGRASKTVIR
jgi:hypothetical protein